MVREREPATPGRKHISTTSTAREPLQETAMAPNDHVAGHFGDDEKDKHKHFVDLTDSPQFGQPSPLRNSLSKVMHKVEKKIEDKLFHQPKAGQARPEHHKSGGASVQARITSGGFTSYGGAAQSEFKQPAAFGGQNGYGGQQQTAYRPPPVMGYNAHAQPSYGQQPFQISRPQGYQPQTTYAPPAPTFNSINSGFRPVNRVDLTKDDDGFDPDAALRNTEFGAPDPYRYVEASQASDDIKALLEGAFDDDDDKPRLRRRKAKKTAAAPEKGLKSLSQKLEALDVRKDTKEEEHEHEDEEDEDDGTFDGLEVKLLPHQVEGVAWMNDREISRKKIRGVIPQGGILADDMGLGKTIQSIALILANSLPSKEEREKDKKNVIAKDCAKTTLVVAPLALIKQWEAEIKSKVSPSHSLRVLVHHGTNRTKRSEDLKKYDIVITTYQILASEHAASSDSDGGVKIGCFGVHWYRIMLDEAHSIKNKSAKMTQACYALKGQYRWCLTGTPMQNNLDELQSLIRFLRIKPYCEHGPWKEQITGPMKNGRGGIAMRRLQVFLKSCMKRRTKEILKKEGALNPGGKVKPGDENKGFRIVDRKVELVTAAFGTRERQFYDRLADRAQSRLDEMMGGEKSDYIGALVLLLRLRQACNHPQLVGSSAKKDKDALTAGSSNQASGQGTPRKSKKAVDEETDDLADLLGGLTVQTKQCDVCQVDLTKAQVEDGMLRCDECEADLSSLNHDEAITKKKSKKVKKGKVKPMSRKKRVITDSDDEDAEEGGEWLVDDEERTHAPSHGRAGDTHDENAEGGGEWLNSDDSATDSESESRVRTKKLHKNPLFVSDDGESDEGEDAENSDGSLLGVRAVSKPKAQSSTKIQHLLSILADETPKHKVIVFSQFTSMLDLVEPFLTKAGHKFTRYDGSMRNDLREASLDKLRNDKKCRVLLCSLKCGSLGLNLTAASRVVLLEPFWNPFVEEQAIDRVHRLNQTVDVVVYRLTIINTVEERILALQEEKRKLAEAAIEGGKALSKLGMKDLLALFRRDAEDHSTTHGHPHYTGEHSVPGFERTKILDEKPRAAVPVRKDTREHEVYGRRW